MKEVINIYKRHKMTVDNFIITFIKNSPKNYIENAELILSKNRFVQLIYGVDEKYKQATPVICRKRQESDHLGNDKSHYFMKMVLNGEDMYISNPYIHYRTGKASISAVHFMDGMYYVFDINLIELLEELRLIEYNKVHDKFKRAVYLFGSTMLAVVSIALIAYGSYILAKILFNSEEVDFLHDIFKSIIAITLGLAIYDLAKQIFEHEVLFQSFHHPEDKQYKVLGKFLISIVIALSIETLMVVFKIALEDNRQMLSAFYLMIGTTVMFVGLGWFYKTIKGVGCKEGEEE